MKTIPLSQGKFTLVDDEDFDWLNQWKWTCIDGYARRYPTVSGRRVSVCMHRLILSAPEGFEVDHIDGDGLNNQRSNLRICKHAQNCRNQKRCRDSRTGLKGVDFHRRLRKYRARITHDYKVMHLGFFDTAEQACAAYNKAALQIHGEFARPNIL